MTSTSQSIEQEIRQRLGIPPEAQQVLVFAESSHWDPDWLYTSEEYFTRFVRHNLDQALDELARDPRRVYSVECVFFLKRYWEERPERQAAIRDLVNQRRLRLTNSGMTTADTLIPSEEALMRDFLLGQEWLRANGMTQEPGLAYFPDSFGYSHALPSLLNAAGFDQTGITRIDGMLFPGCDIGVKSQFYWPGSSAAALLKQEKTLDFIWRDAEGGEVLCHWNAYTYGQGDMLAYTGIARVYIVNISSVNRTDWNVTAHIKQYLRELQPFARTPYMFCPIGMDFVAPIPDLVPLLDRYNHAHYPHTGVWVVNAGLDDYLALVACHRERLPVLALDPNPYWSGFYTSRPSLKALSQRTIDSLLLAEQLSLLQFDGGKESADDPGALAGELRPAWHQAIASNHHDFIAGTSRDRVVVVEQVPWLEQARLASEGAIARFEKHFPAVLSSPADHAEPVEYHQYDGVIEVATPYYLLDLAEEAGGCIVSAWHPTTHAPLLDGLSNEVISFLDTGGLWRMGQELPGGKFTEIARSGQKPAALQAQPSPGRLEVSGKVMVDGMEFERQIIFRTDTPVIRFSLRGKAAEKRTVVVRFETGVRPAELVMDEPGGVISRPFARKYRPTFWPHKSFVHLQAADGQRGAALLHSLPGAAAGTPEGSLDLITHRNATQEKAYGFIKLPGHPVAGHELAETQAVYGLIFTQGGSWREYHLPRLARTSLAEELGPDSRKIKLADVTGRLVWVDSPDAQIVSVKPADRGEGWMVRILAPAMQGQPVTITPLRQGLEKAWLADARERDLKPLPVIGGSVRLVMPGSIATVRLTWNSGEDSR